jgi:hypothetical protein
MFITELDDNKMTGWKGYAAAGSALPDGSPAVTHAAIVSSGDPVCLLARSTANILIVQATLELVRNGPRYR